MLFLGKAMFNWRSFIDEMSSPTTSSPAGLIFMSIALAFTGKGDIGELLVIFASLLHLVLVAWFIYMSLAYQTMPGEYRPCISTVTCIIGSPNIHTTFRSFLVSEYSWNSTMCCKSLVLLPITWSFFDRNHPHACATLLSNKFDPCCNERKDVCYSQLPSNDVSSSMPLFTCNYNGAIFPRRKAGHFPFPSTAKINLSSYSVVSLCTIYHRGSIEYPWNRHSSWTNNERRIFSCSLCV